MIFLCLYIIKSMEKNNLIKINENFIHFQII